MTIDNGMLGATVKADMVLAGESVAFENVESEIQWIDIIDQWVTDDDFSYDGGSLISFTWTSFDPDTGELEGTYTIQSSSMTEEVPASGTLDTATGTLTMRSLEAIKIWLSTYEPKTYVCHIDPLYGTFVDEDGYAWCPAIKDADTEE